MHASGYRKLGKTTPQRKALLRNQVTNLLYHGKIQKQQKQEQNEVKRIAEKADHTGYQRKMITSKKLQ